MAERDPLLRELQFLGIDETTVELLALLPLIQVAWADGEVQEQERELILDLATSRYHLGAEARTMLQNWLTHAPSEQYVARGRTALLALAHEREDFDIDSSKLDDVVEFSKAVAAASGGFLGFRSVDAEESSVLEEIAEALHISGAKVAADLFGADEELTDDATDVKTAEQMAQIRESAHLARAPQPRELSGEALADLIHHGTDGATNFPMDEHGLSIGRSAVNDVQIPHDGQISRVHARIVYEDGKFYAEDNDTTNGTWVNGERVVKRRLFGGEQIAVGDAHFTYLGR